MDDRPPATADGDVGAEAAPPPAGRSQRLSSAVGSLWAMMADDYGLVPDLDLDALLARADRGELALTTPRLVDLIVSNTAAVADAAGAVDRLGRHRWEPSARVAVGEAFDAWWLETLKRRPGEHQAPYRPEVVLGVLVGFDRTMVRWLGPWLDELDGPGAIHLADVVLGGPDGLSASAWAGKDDEARQVLAWARTEPVVNGLTLIGGIHLGPDVLGRVLDRLVG